MTTNSQDAHLTTDEPLEKILAHAMVDLAGELRLIDSIDVLSEQANGRTGNIADMVASAAELFFHHGTVFASHLQCTTHEAPRSGPVSFNLMFRNTGVEARFDLRLAESHTEILLRDLHYRPPARCQDTRLQRLRHALQTARLAQPLDLLREAHGTHASQRLAVPGE